MNFIINSINPTFYKKLDLWPSEIKRITELGHLAATGTERGKWGSGKGKDTAATSTGLGCIICAMAPRNLKTQSLETLE